MVFHAKLRRIAAATTTTAALVCGLVTPAHAAVATVTSNQCVITDPTIEELGVISGKTGQFFTRLREVIRADTPQAWEEFETIDRLLAEGQGSSAEAARAYTRLDEIMHSAGYKYGEFRLALPQYAANNTAYNPMKPISPADAKAVADSPNPGQAVAQAGNAANLQQMAKTYKAKIDALYNGASPQLSAMLQIAEPYLRADGDAIADTDWNLVLNDYGNAVKSCHDQFTRAGVTAINTGSVKGALPELYIPDLSTLRGISGPVDTGIFAPLEDVELLRGESSELKMDSIVLVLSLVFAILATRGPALLQGGLKLPSLPGLPGPVPAPGA